MPFILDNIIVYLVRLILRIVREIRTLHWLKSEAVVHQSFPEHGMYPSASFTYSYKVDGEKHAGKYKRGFWENDSATDFASRYPRSRRVVIRYRSDRPGKSYFLEGDQKVSPLHAAVN
jgi:hypothetical protein